MTQILSALTVFAQIEILVLVFLLVTDKNRRSKILKKFAKIADKYTFVMALIATLGSLYYSEIAGFEPCKYCWFQRILMYPLTIIMFIAIRIKDKYVSRYVLPISVMGTLLAGYHYLTQLGWLPSTCIATGYSVGCAKVFVMTFGYITIPMMSFTAFLLIVVLQIISKRYSSGNR
ncbi:MAG: disulfide bond formation protein B [Patescibacteria group bacterium]